MRYELLDCSSPPPTARKKAQRLVAARQLLFEKRCEIAAAGRCSLYLADGLHPLLMTETRRSPRNPRFGPGRPHTLGPDTPPTLAYTQLKTE